MRYSLVTCHACSALLLFDNCTFQPSAGTSWARLLLLAQPVRCPPVVFTTLAASIFAKQGGEVAAAGLLQEEILRSSQRLGTAGCISGDSSVLRSFLPFPSEQKKVA